MPPKLDPSREYDDKQVNRWSRLLQRQWCRAKWHFVGVLLWLVQRPQLRCWPTPHPGTTTWQEYQTQPGEPLVSPSLFADLVTLRSKMGLKLAFLGVNCVEKAMKIAMPGKGVLQKAKAAAAMEGATPIDLNNPRASFQSLGVGPKGGMPKTKAELVRLATALTIATDGTVSELTTRCREAMNEFNAIMATQTARKVEPSGIGSQPADAVNPRLCQTANSVRKHLNWPTDRKWVEIREKAKLEAQALQQPPTGVSSSSAPSVATELGYHEQLRQAMLESQRQSGPPGVNLFQSPAVSETDFFLLDDDAIMAMDQTGPQ